MEETKLQLEAGKEYNLKGGMVASCIARSVGNDQHFVMQFREGRRFSGALFKVYSDGFCFWSSSSIQVKEEDLHVTSIWVELKRIKGWLNVYENLHPQLRKMEPGPHVAHLGTTVYHSKAEADHVSKNYGDMVRLACIEIDTVEGAGLEGGR